VSGRPGAVAIADLRLVADNLESGEWTCLDSDLRRDGAAVVLRVAMVPATLNVTETPVKVCANCKHWQRPWGEYRDCLAAAITDMRPDNGTRAFVSGLGAGLHTLPTFGCVLFEAKEEG
jgi:hypothetical protein